MQEYNRLLKAQLLEAVDNQIAENNPPATKTPLKRLMDAGYSKQAAKEKIAAVLVNEMYDIMKYGRPFDEAKYTRELNALK